MYLTPEEEALRSSKNHEEWTLKSFLISAFITVLIYIGFYSLFGEMPLWIVGITFVVTFRIFYLKWANRILTVDQDEVVIGLDPWGPKRYIHNGDGNTGTDPEEFTQGDHVIPPQLRDLQAIVLKKDVELSGTAVLSKLSDDDNVSWKYFIKYKPNARRIAWYKLISDDESERVKIINQTLLSIIDNVIEMFCANETVEKDDGSGPKQKKVGFEDLFDKEIRNKLIAEINKALTESAEEGKLSSCDDMGIIITELKLRDLKRSDEQSQAIQAASVMNRYSDHAKRVAKENGVSGETALNAMLAVGGQQNHSIGIIVSGSEESLNSMKETVEAGAKTYLATLGKKKGGK